MMKSEISLHKIQMKTVFEDHHAAARVSRVESDSNSWLEPGSVFWRFVLRWVSHSLLIVSVGV